MSSIRHLKPHYILNKIIVIRYEKTHPHYPWLSQQANSILDTLLKPTDMGFEWGSGRSTTWIAKRIKHLTSIEHGEVWYTNLCSKIKERDIHNVTYHFCKLNETEKTSQESDYVQITKSFNEGSLDFILVDGRLRDICSNSALDKLHPGGILVIDNINRNLPSNFISPSSIPTNGPPKSDEWARSQCQIRDWRYIWTSNRVWYTAIWFKPHC